MSVSNPQKKISEYRFLMGMDEGVLNGAWFWMDKNGTLLSAKFGHTTAARNYLSSKNIEFDTDNDYQKMYELGFLRIDKGYDTLHFDYDLRSGQHPTPKQLKELNNLAIENHLKLVDDMLDRELELYEGLSFSDQYDDSIPYEVKPPQMLRPMEEVEFPQDSRITGYGWMDIKGKYHRAEGSHQDWAKHYLQTIHPEWTNSDFDVRDLYYELYKLGFLRIIAAPSINTLYFSYDKSLDRPNITQLRTLKDAAIEHRWELFDDELNKVIDLNETVNEVDFPIQTKNLFKGLHEDDLPLKSSYTGFWLDRSGKFHGTYNHIVSAEEYLKKNNIEFDPRLSRYRDMYKLGFVRVVKSNSYRQIRFEYGHIKPNHKQIAELKNIAIELNYHLYDDVTDKPIELLESIKEGSGIFISNMKPEQKEEFKSSMAKLFSYLKDKLKLKTIPKVHLLEDKTNAKKLLGRTGYYDPDNQKICLYMTDRHPKDILRSFSHEIIHHWQHENKQLDKSEKTGESDPQYAQNDPWMRQMEKQAYLLGNIMFRDWEDDKKSKDRKSNKKLTERTYSIGNEYPPKKTDYSG